MPSPPVSTLVPDYLFGTLAADERARFERALAEDADLRAQVTRSEEALADLAAALPGAGKPAGHAARARLLASIDGVERFAPFFAALGKLAALPADALRTVLAKVDDSRAFTTVKQGIAMCRFAVGEGAAARYGTLLRLAPNARFPRHQHLGPEFGFVLEGAGHDEGQIYEPGAIIEHATGTTHDFYAGEHRDLVLAVVHDDFTFV